MEHHGATVESGKDDSSPLVVMLVMLSVDESNIEHVNPAVVLVSSS